MRTLLKNLFRRPTIFTRLAHFWDHLLLTCEDRLALLANDLRSVGGGA
jgi:hypothetical protein